jgi:hypothetical protein
MSRGPGRLQRALIGLFLEKAPKLLTWDDIKTRVCEDTKFDKAMFSIVHRSLERSIRRALQGMSSPITNRLPTEIVTIPRDGRSRFYAYFPPFYVLYMPIEEARKLWAEIDATPDHPLQRFAPYEWHAKEDDVVGKRWSEPMAKGEPLSSIKEELERNSRHA